MIKQTLRAMIKQFLPEGVEPYLSDNFDRERFEREGKIFFTTGTYEPVLFDDERDAKAFFERAAEDFLTSIPDDTCYRLARGQLSMTDCPAARDRPALLQFTFTDSRKVQIEIIDELSAHELFSWACDLEETSGVSCLLAE